MINPVLRFSLENGDSYPDWSTESIESLCDEILGGGTPSKSNATYWNGDIPWISSSDLSLDKIDEFSVTRFISVDAVKHSATKIIKKDSVLIVSRVGVGKVAVAPFDLCTSQDFTNLVAVKCNPYFLAYALRRLMGMKVKSVQGTAIKGIPATELKKASISLPSEEEQQKIATFFSTLDEKISCTEKKIDLVRMVFNYFLNRYMSDVRGYDLRLIEEIASISSASRVHKNEWTNEGVPFFRSSDVVSNFKNQENSLGKAYISTELYQKLIQKSGKLEKGDILVTGGGSVGIPFLIESDDPIYTKDADLLWVKPRRKLVGSKFLYYYLISRKFRQELGKISHQGTISHLTISQLRKFAIPLPEIPEQERMVNKLDLLDLSLRILQRKAMILKTLKQGLMQQIFV